MSSPPVKPLVLPASDPAALEQVAALLRAGELVAFPTDTVYGVGAIFSNVRQSAREISSKLPLKAAVSDSELPDITTGLSGD